MRKLLIALISIVLLVLIGTGSLVYLFRDQWLLSETRKQLAKVPGVQVEIGSLKSALLGPFSLTLFDLTIAQGNTTTKIKELKLASPLTVLGLYSAYRAGTELPLLITLNQPSVALPQTTPGAETKNPSQTSAPWPTSLALPALSPVPLHASITVEQGSLQGRFTAKQVEGNLDLRARAESFEAKGAFALQATLPGGEASLPVKADFLLVGTRKALKLQGFEFSAAGISAAALGELSLEPVSGQFKLSAEALDLSRLALRPEDRAALGLASNPSGSFTLKMEANASPAGALTASGTVSLGKAFFSLSLPERTLFSKAMEGSRAQGIAALSAELPFRIAASWPLGEKPADTNATLHATLDLGNLDLEKKGMLRKPKGVPLSADLRATVNANGVTIDALTARFHSLTLSGSGELPPPMGNLIRAQFKVQAPSLAGFPELLPILNEAQSGGAALAEAQGSIAAEGKMSFVPATPAKSTVDFRALSFKNVRLPVSFKNETLEATGLLLANLSGAGKYEAGALSVAQSTGNADLSGLSLRIPGKLEKKKGRQLLIAFEARGTPERLVVKKASLNLSGLSANIDGNIVSSQKGRIQLDLNAATTAELAPLREYLPALPITISSGSFSAKAKVGGAWLNEGGIEKSPLLISATMQGKLGNIEMPPAVSEEAKAKASAPAPLLPDWPVARRLKLGFLFDVDRFTRGKLHAEGIRAQGNLIEGNFLADVTVAKTFGGKASLKKVAGTLTQTKLPVKGQAHVEGMNLSLMAGFVDPSFAEIVKGTLKADSNFEVPDVWSESLLQTAAASGKAEIKNGYVSTASLDSLVNAKLAGIPGIGDKAKISTGGMAAEMRTDFFAAGGIATLKNFFAVTPKKDEMLLNGTMNLAFDCDMAGEARLVNAPVQGAVREANSDAQGRLVVPIRFRGNLKNPSIDIAAETIQAMLGKTATNEAAKLKDKAITEGRKKLEDEAKKATGNLLKDLFKKK